MTTMITLKFSFKLFDEIFASLKFLKKVIIKNYFIEMFFDGLEKFFETSMIAFSTICVNGPC